MHVSNGSFPLREETDDVYFMTLTALRTLLTLSCTSLRGSLNAGHLCLQCTYTRETRLKIHVFGGLVWLFPKIRLVNRTDRKRMSTKTRRPEGAFPLIPRPVCFCLLFTPSLSCGKPRPRTAHYIRTCMGYVSPSCKLGSALSKHCELSRRERISSLLAQCHSV